MEKVDNEWKNCPYCGSKLLKVKIPKTKKDSNVTGEEAIQEKPIISGKENVKISLNALKLNRRKILFLLVFAIVAVVVISGVTSKFKKTDIHDIDIGNILGEKAEDFEKLNIEGLIKYEEGYAAEDSNTMFFLNDRGSITRISVVGEEERTPSICGVYIGTPKYDAQKKLQNRFVLEQNVVDEFQDYEQYKDTITGANLEINYSVIGTVANMEFYF